MLSMLCVLMSSIRSEASLDSNVYDPVCIIGTEGEFAHIRVSPGITRINYGIVPCTADIGTDCEILIYIDRGATFSAEFTAYSVSSFIPSAHYSEVNETFIFFRSTNTKYDYVSISITIDDDNTNMLNIRHTCIARDSVNHAIIQTSTVNMNDMFVGFIIITCVIAFVVKLFDCVNLIISAALRRARSSSPDVSELDKEA